jgi:hypothetical protein
VTCISHSRVATHEVGPLWWTNSFTGQGAEHTSTGIFEKELISRGEKEPMAGQPMISGGEWASSSGSDNQGDQGSYL